MTNADDSTTALDSRPSDAIALALRANAPIFASETVLQEEAEAAEEFAREENQVEVLEGEEEPTADGINAAIADLMQRAKTSTDNPLSEVDQLKKRLDQAVSEEAFEEAARLRDLIAERAKQGE